MAGPVQVPSFKIRLAFDNAGMRIEQVTHGAGSPYRQH
jgi:hypothetical protein